MKLFNREVMECVYAGPDFFNNGIPAAGDILEKPEPASPYPQNHEAKIFCPECGVAVGPTDKFCSTCGWKLTGGFVPQPAPIAEMNDVYAGPEPPDQLLD